jgi:hypothetical protein
MNKKGQLNIGGIMIIFVAIIFGIVLLTPIFAQQNLVTEKQSTTNQTVSLVTAYIGANEVNESINYTIYSQSDWKQSECPLTSVSLKNATGTAWTLTTDYLLYADAGVFSIVNTTTTVPATTGNQTFVYYTYCADGYNPDASSRSVARLWGLFGALIILGASFFGIKEWLNNR